MPHHRDGISQVMSSAWCLQDIVLGILPKEFNISPENLFPDTRKVIKQAVICLLLKSGFHRGLPYCKGLTAEIVVLLVGFSHLHRGLPKSVRVTIGILVISLTMALLAQFRQRTNSRNSPGGFKLLPFHNY